LKRRSAARAPAPVFRWAPHTAGRAIRGATIVLVWATALPGPLAGQGQEPAAPAAPESLDALEARVEALRGTGSPEQLREAYRELATARNSLGLLHWRQARYDSAIHHLRESRDLWAELDDTEWLGRVYNNIGVTHYQWGNYEPALDAFLRSLTLRRDLDDRRGQALVLTNVGRTYHDWHQHDRARAAFEEAIALADAADDPFVRAYALHNLGILYMTLEELPRAREMLQASLDGYEIADGRVNPAQAGSGRALNRLALGLIDVREGDTAQGIALIEAVLADAVTDDHPRRQARALLHLGQAYRLAGDLPSAIATLERAVAVAREAGQRTLVAEALGDLAAAHEARGEHRLALARLRAHDALQDSIFNHSAVQRIAAMEARAEADLRERENVRLREERRVREALIARQRAVVGLGSALLVVSMVLVAVLVHSNRTGRRRRLLLARTNHELRAALSEVRTLEGLIPICAHCKKVRDDDGFWEAVETYISSRSDALFSHGICTECGPRLYGDDWVQLSGEPAGGPTRDEPDT
jgi:tetratricopeptide (TPR) repeat protein